MTETFSPRPGSDNGAKATVRVWDPLVRVFHWGLVAAFALAWLTADEAQQLHEVSGYVVAGLIGFRLVWGLVGSRYARFSQFVRGPRKTLAYLRDAVYGDEPRYLGHNPAGAAMIVAILLMLSGTAFTGWLMAEPDRMALLPALPQVVSPAYADDDNDDDGAARRGDESDAEGALKDVHEVFANLMLVLVALHLGGVVLASVRHRENLARAMLTGDKRAPGRGDIA